MIDPIAMVDPRPKVDIIPMVDFMPMSAIPFEQNTIASH